MGARTLVDVGIPVLVVFLMGLVGLSLEGRDFRRVLERRWLVAATLLVQPLVLPLMAAGAGWLVGVGPLSLVALVLIAACPAGVLSNVYTLVARGNAALSVALTAAGTLLSVVTLPLVTTVGLALVSSAGESGVTVPLSRTVADLVFTILVPVGLGMAARPALLRSPWIEKGLQVAGALATLALVGLLLVTQWRAVSGDLARLALAVVVFSLAAVVVGGRLARALTTDRVDAVALVLELPGRNLGVAAIVGVHSLGRPEIAGLCTAVFLVQVPLMLAVSLALRRVRARRPAPSSRVG